LLAVLLFLAFQFPAVDGVLAFASFSVDPGVPIFSGDFVE
jgi:hypothetical protein